MILRKEVFVWSSQHLRLQDESAPNREEVSMAYELGLLRGPVEVVH